MSSNQRNNLPNESDIFFQNRVLPTSDTRTSTQYAPSLPANAQYTPSPPANPYYAPSPPSNQYYAPSPSAKTYYTPSQLNNPYSSPSPPSRNQTSSSLLDNGIEKQIFNKYDVDGSGTLNKRELFKAVNEVYTISGFYPVTEGDIHNIADAFDMNGDNKLDYKEFKYLIDKLRGIVKKRA